MPGTDALLRQAITAARAGQREEARRLLMDVTEIEPRNETAWIWLSGLMDGVEDRIIACENVLAINPSNQQIRQYLLRLRGELRTEQEPVPGSEPANGMRPQQPRPDVPVRGVDLAADLEAEGRFDEAIRLYRERAARVGSSQEFDRLYEHITRIEQLQRENIRHVPAATTILRLTSGWSLFYIALVLLQSGLNPFKFPQLTLWALLPLVALGGFLLAVVEIRSRNIVWRQVFASPGVASWLARLVVGGAGWILVILPNLWLIVEALQRLKDLQIPPVPPL